MKKIITYINLKKQFSLWKQVKLLSEKQKRPPGNIVQESYKKIEKSFPKKNKLKQNIENKVEF